MPPPSRAQIIDVLQSVASSSSDEVAISYSSNNSFSSSLRKKNKRAHRYDVRSSPTTVSTQPPQHNTGLYSNQSDVQLAEYIYASSRPAPTSWYWRCLSRTWSRARQLRRKTVAASMSIVAGGPSARIRLLRLVLATMSLKLRPTAAMMAALAPTPGSSRSGIATSPLSTTTAWPWLSSKTQRRQRSVASVGGRATAASVPGATSIVGSPLPAWWRRHASRRASVKASSFKTAPGLSPRSECDASTRVRGSQATAATEASLARRSTSWRARPTLGQSRASRFGLCDKAPRPAPGDMLATPSDPPFWSIVRCARVNHVRGSERRASSGPATVKNQSAFFKFVTITWSRVLPRPTTSTLLSSTVVGRPSFVTS
mmetsp:Transcript_11359/g.33969  ORF Transcript_11359/g.33969 Transcript_11359/m.33969 type:complete len:371 (+) Transcript_11359:981-2093(+)